MADIAYRHPPGIQADNHRIQAIEAPLSFAYQARGERACPVPGDLDLEGSHLRHHGLLRRAVPRVRARLRAGLALLIPQVLGQLRGQAALQGLLEQRGQQSLAARHLDLASIKTLKQRIQRPRATQVLHSLTPTSASHNNIIIIHHASILSNKKTDTQTIEHALRPSSWRVNYQKNQAGEERSIKRKNHQKSASCGESCGGDIENPKADSNPCRVGTDRIPDRVSRCAKSGGAAHEHVSCYYREDNPTETER